MKIRPISKKWAAVSLLIIFILGALALSSSPQAASVLGQDTSQGEQSASPDGESSSMQTLRTFFLADSCGEAQDVKPSYDNCAESESSYGSVESRAILLYDDLDYVEKTGGVIYVEQGTELDYQCVQEPDYYSTITRAWSMDSAGERPDISYSSSGISASHESIPLEGSISVDYDSPTELQLVCADWASDYTGDWAGTAKWVYWNSPIQVAPDTDGDGVYDFNDDCPQQGSTGFGVKDNGCPIQDSDNDRIPDPDDKCPNVAGPEATDGCPDSDSDGVADQNDVCSDSPSGIEVDSSGCAVDSDGDGVPDYQDACPSEGSTGFGVKDNGCPVEDSDSDGVGNDVDQCRNTPEEASVDSNGCAVDSDDDGIPDYEDKCPNQGASEVGLTPGGCPAQDDDGDGVLNRVDECPETFGSKTNGCATLFDSIINTLGLRGVL